MPAPLATRRPFTHRDHGIERQDPWHWVKDREHPDLLPLLNAENHHLEEVLADESVRKRIYDEMLARVKEDDSAPPVRHGPYWWTQLTQKGKAYAIHVRRTSPDGPNLAVLDENEFASGHPYFRLEQLQVAPDFLKVAWLQDVEGSERFSLWTRTLHGPDGGPSEPREIIKDLKWTFAWYNDSRHLLCVRGDAAQRPYQVLRVDTWGENPPTVLLEEPDERFFVSVERSRDGSTLVVDVASKVTSEVLVIDAADPTATPRRAWQRRHGVLAEVEPCGDFWYVRTNDAGVEFRVVRIGARDPEAGMTEVSPHESDIYITGIQAFRDHLVQWERRDGAPSVRIRRHDGMELRRLTFPDPSFHIAPDRNPEFDTRSLRISYSSPRTPDTILAIDLDSDVRTVLKVQPVPDFDPDRYVVELLNAAAPDGALVPITLLRRKQDGPTSGPLYLVGYGAYGYAYPASFRSSRFTLVDRGVIVAIAHVRGGTERGRRWYEEGKLENKPTTFTDFVAAAEHLIRESWTSPANLAIQGGSAGGLLMGAVLNLRPELFRACVAHVPFVDVASTMMDPSLPLTVTEYEEWGDPNQAEVFRRILQYSPYDNVRPAPYPALFATAGLHDPRVGYWEPTKWVQAIRANSTSGRPVLFRVHLGAGHGGQSGRYGQLDDLAWEYHFVLSQIAPERL